MENLIYTEAYITKSLDGEQWELDPNGNPYIIIEASNENLDYDREKVLRSALMDSKDIFLETGVVSYDHRHLSSPANRAYDPDWNAEKYIIGKPSEAWEAKNKKGDLVVFVKAVLYKSNKIAKEIIGKLKDGAETVKASVGGRRVSKAVTRDEKSHLEVDTIVSVEWNEIALTYKPVNQTLGETTLCPVDFVKAMTAGSSVDPGNMGHGGNTLQTQSLEGDAINTLMISIREGKLKGKQAITCLMKKGCSEKRAKQILKMIIDKDYIGDIMNAEDDDVKDVSKSITEDLQKALDDMDTLSKGKKDGTYVMKGGYEYMKKANGKYEKMDDESPDYEEDEEDEDDDDDDDTVGKSIGDDSMLDATDIITDLQKSMRVQSGEIKELSGMVKSLVKMIPAQGNVLKSLAAMNIEQDVLIKSIAGTPQARQSAVDKLNLQARFKKGEGNLSKSQKDSLGKFTDVNTMVKALADAKVNPITRQRACSIFTATRNNGGVGVAGVIQEMPELLNVLAKEV